ncbi:hypothetical protein CA51_47540 [Rosistilla oblonga]|nr:hypothetical protein CA51_47540 [Rosistilla oblonga]
MKRYMIQNILTLSTTVAIVLHALLGCCVHHEHACASQEISAVSQSMDHCHGHHHDAGNRCNDGQSDQQSQDAPHPPCDEIDCSLISVVRNLDVSLLFSVTTWVPALDYTAARSAQASLTSRYGSNDPPDLFFGNQPLRTLTQVWRL